MSCVTAERTFDAISPNLAKAAVALVVRSRDERTGERTVDLDPEAGVSEQAHRVAAASTASLSRR